LFDRPSPDFPPLCLARIRRQVQEWDAVIDPSTTQLYYQNNVSGDVMWDMPESMDLIGAMCKLERLDFSHNGLKVRGNAP
jgi:hypothetical protein